jgi:hypothetical protein
MPIQTKDEAQDKFSRKADKGLNKKKKHVPLKDQTWGDLTQRGASLAEQLEWIKLKKKTLNLQ